MEISGFTILPCSGGGVSSVTGVGNSVFGSVDISPGGVVIVSIGGCGGSVGGNSDGFVGSVEMDGPVGNIPVDEDPVEFGLLVDDGLKQLRRQQRRPNAGQTIPKPITPFAMAPVDGPRKMSKLRLFNTLFLVFLVLTTILP